MDDDKFDVRNTPVRDIGHDYALYSLIASIVGFVTGLGLIGGIVGYIFVKKAQDLGEDSDLLMAGKICSIVSIVLGVITLLALVFFIVFTLFAAGTLSTMN